MSFSSQEFSENIIENMSTEIMICDQNLNITGRNRAQEKISRDIKEHLVENLIEGSPDPIITTDSHGIINFYSKGMKETFGYQEKELIGRPVYDYYTRGKEEAKTIMRLLKEKKKFSDYETDFKAKGGKTVPVALSASLLKDEEGIITGTLGILRDITERKRFENELKKLSITDDLSGLYNRRHFYHKLEEEMIRARRQKLPLSLLLFDLDGFKAYNDNHSHLKGDELIKETGRIIIKCIREKVDSGYRYGGDEFTIILPGVDRKHAHLIAERIRKSMEKTRAGNITLSMGLVEYNLKTPINTLVGMADDAMYAAKKSGGNRIHICR